jgi:hypothetical protein
MLAFNKFSVSEPVPILSGDCSPNCLNMVAEFYGKTQNQRSKLNCSENLLCSIKKFSL